MQGELEHFLRLIDVEEVCASVLLYVFLPDQSPDLICLTGLSLLGCLFFLLPPRKPSILDVQRPLPNRHVLVVFGDNVGARPGFAEIQQLKLVIQGAIHSTGDTSRLVLHSDPEDRPIESGEWHPVTADDIVTFRTTLVFFFYFLPFHSTLVCLLCSLLILQEKVSHSIMTIDVIPAGVESAYRKLDELRRGWLSDNDSRKKRHPERERAGKNVVFSPFCLVSNGFCGFLATSPPAPPRLCRTP